VSVGRALSPASAALSRLALSNPAPRRATVFFRVPRCSAQPRLRARPRPHSAARRLSFASRAGADRRPALWTHGMCASAPHIILALIAHSAAPLPSGHPARGYPAPTALSRFQWFIASRQKTLSCENLALNVRTGHPPPGPGRQGPNAAKPACPSTRADSGLPPGHLDWRCCPSTSRCSTAILSHIPALSPGH